MIKYLRMFTRIFAIPFIILMWVLHIMSLACLFIVSLLDLRIEEFDGGYAMNLFDLIREFWEMGVDSL